ncbi:hypothetical protein [Alicyclobacillus sendaiensis]|uniref:Uncharacterized protein n=1 Tax=Alicyclobacillus sendaiensis PA2 TaxID=3029425 RepID=A0ABT6Y1K9_ALISE|nr:hypothetical protein [Alicyclobacillus sendaiensis]MDI9261236.1 hypothetical protein [Alicyclobacillus sendaiensis PA2]
MIEFAVWEHGRVRLKRGLCLGVVAEDEYPPTYENRRFHMAYDPNQPCDETRLVMAVPRFCNVSVVYQIYLVVPQATVPWDRGKLREVLMGKEGETPCAV